MISVVTAYYNRKKLFTRTLDSMMPHFGTIDFEVIVVDDGSDEHERLEDLTKLYPFLRVIRLEKQQKWYKNPCIPFNIGFSEAKGDKIILQNPECYHLDAILPYVNAHLVDNTYLSFGCYSLDKENTDNEELFADKNHIRNTIANNNYAMKMDGELGWYNHSVHRPAAFHFCAALTYKDLFDLGGFDPRYAWGVGFDDNEFVWRVRQKGMHIRFEDDIVVLHQNHYKFTAANHKDLIEDKSKQYVYNSNVLQHITETGLLWRVNYLNNPHQEMNFENTAREEFIRSMNRYVTQISKYKYARQLMKLGTKICSKLKF